jgi:hypothetical protein
MRHLRKELNRLVQYAESLGIKVEFKDSSKGHVCAEWTTDGTEITVYSSKSKSITQNILDLLHEVSHHIAWTHKGRKTPIRTDEALMAEDRRHKKSPPIPKSKRKIIYEDERFDSQYQELIYNELGLKIPRWKVQAERDLSNWIYYRYFQSGDYPGSIETKAKKQELVAKYRGKANDS